MNVLGWIALASASFGSCNPDGGKAKPNTEIAAADTAGSSTRTYPFFNGITEVNKGLKTGTVQLKGTVPGAGIRKLYLYEMEGKTNVLIDSTVVNGSTFDFGKKTYEAGMYAVGVNDQNTIAVILNPSEPVVEIGFKAVKLDNGPVAINSKENEGWFKYYPQEIMILQQIKDNMIAQAKSSLKDKFDQVIYEKDMQLANLQGDLIKQYPNTFFAKLLTWKQEPERSNKDKYWDNIDFTDESIVHCLVMPDRIQNFMRKFSGGAENGFLNCVDLVVEKSKVNERVLEFNLYNMLNGFYESGMENIAVYITDNYIFGEGCGDAEISNVLRSKAEGIVNLRIGKTPPNIQMKGIDGSNVDLYKLCAKNKYVLVMFWSSWCEHCKGEAPEVKFHYDNWHPKGFEILGVSVDSSRQPWEAAVKDRGFIFPNVVGMKLWDSKVAKDYKVTKTPAFFLLNSKAEIVLKPKSMREVNVWLTQNLK